jgi:hypothetical protein
MTDAALRTHCERVIAAIQERKVIPFLGAAVNAYGREEDSGAWYKRNDLPTTAELTKLLVTRYHYPTGSWPPSLSSVAQFVDIDEGHDALRGELRKTFTRSYEPSPLLRLLAEQRADRRSAWQLLVTTNYDDALEKAFHAAGVEHDVVYYSAPRERPGKFHVVGADGRRETIRSHTGPFSFSPARRPVILKIHGTVDRRASRNDSYVISENDYIAYLAGDLEKLLPSNLAGVMRRSRFLFLGYSLSDWNLRVMLFHHIWKKHMALRSWAIQRDPTAIDSKFWERKEVELVKADLGDWTAAMKAVAS